MPQYIDDRVFLHCLMEAEQDTGRRATLKAISQSQGKYSAKKLAAMGHPYSTRFGGEGVPYGDPGKINVQLDAAEQRGEEPFSLQWHLNGPTYSGNQIETIIGNSSKIAGVLETGKKSTIPRPLIESIIPVVEYWRMFNLMKGIKKAITLSR